MTIDELFIILTMDKPSRYLLSKEEDLFNLIPDLKKCKNFNQFSDWHPYDVYTHILKVVDGTPKVLPIRLAALFHDIGKPHTFRLDDNNVGHFQGHWEVSRVIFNNFAIKNSINDNLRILVEKLIYYHDMNVGRLTDDELLNFVSLFSEEEMDMLFRIKRADLLAQNPKYHHILNDYVKQQVKLYKLYDEEYHIIKEDIKHIILGTGSIHNIKQGNKVYISNYPNAYKKLIPKDKTIETYNHKMLINKNNKNQIEDEFIKSYYTNRLQHINIKDLIYDLYDKYGENIILLSDESIDEFSHRRIVADYLELKTGVYIPEVIEVEDIKRINPIRYKQRIKRML